MKSLFLKLNLHGELLLIAEMHACLGTGSTELAWVQKDLQQQQKTGLYNTHIISASLWDQLIIMIRK